MLINLTLSTITTTFLLLVAVDCIPTPETGMGLLLYFFVVVNLGSFWMRRR